jgi:hypothetical protein
MQSIRIAKLFLRIISVALGTWLITLLAIPLFGSAWHILHGDFISYQGWKIPVPKGFYVRNSHTEPTMWKHSIGSPFFSAPYGHISLFNRPNQQPFVYQRDYSNFEKNLTDDARRSGYKIDGMRTTSVGNQPAYCLQFTRSSDESQLLLRCVIENSPVALFYEGSPRYAPDAFAALRGMSLLTKYGAGSNESVKLTIESRGNNAEPDSRV